MMQYCTNCGQKIFKKTCPYCGAQQNSKHNYCAWCGEKVNEEEGACDHCQEPIKKSLIQKITTVIGWLFILYLGYLTVVTVRMGVYQSSVAFLAGLLLLLPVTMRMLLKFTHERRQFRALLVAARVLLVVGLFLVGFWFYNETVVANSVVKEDVAIQSAEAILQKDQKLKKDDSYVLNNAVMELEEDTDPDDGMVPLAVTLNYSVEDEQGNLVDKEETIRMVFKEKNGKYYRQDTGEIAK